MFGVDLPGRTGDSAADASIVASVTTYSTGAGRHLGLVYQDVHPTPTLTPVQPRPTGRDNSTVTATYLKGPSGIAEQAGMPILPLQTDNVAYPGTVLRGVGFRGGTYSDLVKITYDNAQVDILPLMSDPSADLSAPRVPFYSNIFYPAQLWRVNYLGALSQFDAGGASTSGPTYLMALPAQYRSSAPDSLTGTLRKFSQLDLRLFYSANTSAAALAAPPAIANVSATRRTPASPSPRTSSAIPLPAWFRPGSSGPRAARLVAPHPVLGSR